ncbi:hypothetical protein BCV70DRAFT_191417 [Testicularia cyperi]|uniref:Armadillo-like helical domain-containing protein n=1 Tax=Testicularia cyperi TaxID=1882483 RepID=A0A317XM75_9BASI|nr:hypothetical protein BCV70DRAFT_191417 [Testicularia cyperi]
MSSFGSSRPQLQTKFSECYTALLAGKQPWNEDSSGLGASSSVNGGSTLRPAYSRSKSTGKSNSGPRARYYADLLCLPVESRLVIDQLSQFSADALLDDDPLSKGGLVRENVGSLWREAIRVWRESDEDQVRRRNAVDTLVALSYPILSKRFANYSFDIITIFAGGMDEADEVFTSLVDSIHDTLRGGSSARTRIPSSIRSDDDDAVERREREWIDTEVQHRTLQLGLLWLACTAQTSLAAYFLRRDLFVTVSGFIGTPQGSVFAYEGALFLGLLATVGQSSSGGLSVNTSTSNPYARRFRDWVDQDCMQKILISSSRALERSIQAYVEVSDDTPATIVGNIAGFASLKWMSSLSDMVGTAPTKKASPTTLAIGDFSQLPPSASVIMLPIFLLSRSNQAFTSLILDVPAADTEEASEKDQTEGQHPQVESRVGLELYCNLVSLASYLSTHASVSPRSGSYARMALLTLLILLYDPRCSQSLLNTSKRATEAVAKIRLCRQREPVLALPRRRRTRLLTTNLDVATCSIRYNLSKRIDVAAYLISLKIVQRSIVLCSEARLHIEYDWNDCWSSLFGLATFIVGRYGEMRTGADVPELVKALISTLNSALVRSDHFLATLHEVHHLIYELVRNSHVLRRLVVLVDPTTARSRNGSTDMSSLSLPGALGSATPAPTPPKVYALMPGWKNLERVIQSVESKLSDWVAERPSSRKNKTPEIATVMKLIAALDLEQLLAGGAEEERPSSLGTSESRGPLHQDLERLDRMQEQNLPEFVRHSCTDVLRILPIF